MIDKEWSTSCVGINKTVWSYSPKIGRSVVCNVSRSMGPEVSRLIAAAPDLLSAAESLIADFSDTNPEELEFSGFQELIKAVKKARGRK